MVVTAKQLVPSLSWPQHRGSENASDKLIEEHGKIFTRQRCVRPYVGISTMAFILHTFFNYRVVFLVS